MSGKTTNKDKITNFVQVIKTNVGCYEKAKEETFDGKIQEVSF